MTSKADLMIQLGRMSDQLTALATLIADLPDIDYEPAVMPLEPGVEPVFRGRAVCVGCGTDTGSYTSIGLLCPGCFNSTPNVS